MINPSFGRWYLALRIKEKHEEHKFGTACNERKQVIHHHPQFHKVGLLSLMLWLCLITMIIMLHVIEYFSWTLDDVSMLEFKIWWIKMLRNWCVLTCQLVFYCIWIVVKVRDDFGRLEIALCHENFVFLGCCLTESIHVNFELIHEVYELNREGPWRFKADQTRVELIHDWWGFNSICWN